MGNNNQTSNNSNTSTKERLRIEIGNDTKKNFHDEEELGIKTFKSQQIADEFVNPMFKGVFKDYKGCMIKVEPNNRVTVDLYFVKGITSDAPYEAITPISKTGTDILSRIKYVSMMNNRNKIYQLTDEAKEILSEFMLNKNRKNEVLWKESYVEIEGVTETGIRQATAKVCRLDLNIMIRKIYGYYAENKSKQFFNVTPLRKLIPMNQVPGMPMSNDWLLRVECLNEKATEDTLKLLGNTGVVNGIPMYQVQ